MLVTLQRHAKARGYFSPERFTGRTDEAIISHDVAHVWQQSHGTRPRRSYHHRQWAAKMKEIGLQPSTTGEPGGKETGQSVTHYILPGGPYAKAYPRPPGQVTSSTRRLKAATLTSALVFKEAKLWEAFTSRPKGRAWIGHETQEYNCLDVEEIFENEGD